MVRLQIMYILVLALSLCLIALLLTVFFLSPSSTTHAPIIVDHDDTWRLNDEEEPEVRGGETFQEIETPQARTEKPDAGEQHRMREARQFEEERVRKRDSILARIDAKQQHEVTAPEKSSLYQMQKSS